MNDERTPDQMINELNQLLQVAIAYATMGGYKEQSDGIDNKREQVMQAYRDQEADWHAEQSNDDWMDP